jgi:hypothetical protein
VLVTDAFRIVVDENGRFARGLNDLERQQMPFAVMQAINRTAFDVRQRWAEIMPRIFDRPTRLTLNAPLYRKATKQKLEAEIFIRDEAFKGTPPAKYLAPQVTGGARRTKRFERALQARGILPAGWFAVPGKGAELDAFGNISGRQIVRILSQLRAFGEQGYSANETDATRARRQKREKKKRRGDYFAVRARRGGLAPGVYQRVSTGFGRGTVPVLIFVRRASYRARYPLFDIAKTIYDRRFPDNFRRELDAAVASSFKGRA